MRGPVGTTDRFEASQSDEGRYRMLVEAVTDYAIYMLDPQGIVSSWNSGARRFKGYESSEIIGKHFSNFYTDEDKATGLPKRALETAARMESSRARDGASGRTARSFGPMSSSIRSSTIRGISLATPRSRAI
jgi:PAS domain S-box-containing protein